MQFHQAIVVFFHLPLLYLNTKQIDLTAQSIIIAIHTPTRPIPSVLPISTAHPILNIHIDATPTTIVYVTSLDALRTFGKENEIGHNTIAHPQFIVMISDAMLAVSAERP